MREQFSPPVRRTNLNIDTTQSENWKLLNAVLEEMQGFYPCFCVEAYFVIGTVN